MNRVHTSLFISIFFLLALAMPTRVSAQSMTGGCTAESQCINNRLCVRKTYSGMPSGTYVIAPEGPGCGSSQIGGITPPNSIITFNRYGAQIGLVAFLSKLLNFFALICGIWTLFNFLVSGWLLVTGQSDTKAQSQVKEKLTMTAIGLVIIASSYIAAGLIGLIFFGDVMFILTPQLQSALGTNTP